MSTDSSSTLSPPATPRFVVDAHLGRLARYLRMLGFDVIYGNDPGDPLLTSLAATDERILLTRDRDLLEWGTTDRGYRVRATEPEDRLREVAERFELGSKARPFTRCMRCNTPLERVEKDDVRERLPERTAEHFDEFFLCPTCDQVLWRGSHFDRMQQLIDRTVASTTD